MTSVSPTVTRSFQGDLAHEDQVVAASIALLPGKIQLSIAGEVIATWGYEEVGLTPTSDGYRLEAEGEVVYFTPHRPDDFAAALAAPGPVEPEAPSALVWEDTGDDLFAAGMTPDLTVVSPIRTPLARSSDPVPVERPPAAPAGLNPGSTVIQAGDDSALDSFLTTLDNEPALAAVEEPEFVWETPLPEPLPPPPTPPPPVAVSPPVERPDFAEDDTPRPSEDEENLRQWALVVAGGLVILGLIGVVGWWLMSNLGGGETPAETVTISSAPATNPPEVVPTTVPSPPPITILPENAAAAAVFVDEWNAIASQYAGHMTVEAETVPISATPAPSVRLTLDDTGVLSLTLTPQGDDNDSDILVAMGMAVAWADPAIDADGRRDLLGVLGIDVDDPSLDAIGGEVDRNGVSYRAETIDGVIRFFVTR